MTLKTYATEELRFKNHWSWDARYPKYLEEFRNATKEHVLTVRHADGLYNHLSFANPATDYSFDVITSPGQLTVRGDLGTAVFARNPDMLRMMDTENRYDIDPQYWLSKIEAFDKSSSLKEFDALKFQHMLLNDFWECSREETTQVTAQAWRVIKDYVYAASAAESIEEVAEILDNITAELEHEKSFHSFRKFSDWEESFYDEWFDFSETYIWVLYAAHFAAQNFVAISTIHQ